MQQIDYAEMDRYGGYKRHYLSDDDLMLKYYERIWSFDGIEIVGWTLVDRKTGKRMFTADDAATMEDVRFKLIEDDRLPGGFALIIFDDYRREIQSNEPPYDGEGNRTWREWTEGCYVEEIFFGDKSVKDGTADEFLADPFGDKGWMDLQSSLTEEEIIDLVIDSDVSSYEAFICRLPLSNGSDILWLEFPDDSTLDTIVTVV